MRTCGSMRIRMASRIHRMQSRSWDEWIALRPTQSSQSSRWHYMSDVKLKHRIEYALFRAAIAGTDMLSDESAARVGEVVGAWGYPLGLKKKVVERNLRIAFPEAGDERRAQLARASYAHLGRETMMM